MRESSSEHKEAHVYLAVMSADPNEEDAASPVQNRRHDSSTPPPPPSPPQGGTGSKTSSRSSNGPRSRNLEQEEGGGEEPAQLSLQTSSFNDSMKVTSDEANAMSAFRITEVSEYDVADDLEQSKGMSREADSFVVDDDKHKPHSESSEYDKTKTKMLVPSSGGSLLAKEQESDGGNERVLPMDGASNGPVTQPVQRRFRRVNKYERGRWMVEDRLEHREAEERPESEMRGAMGTQTSTGSTGGVAGVGRESPFSQRRRAGTEGTVVDEELHSRSSSDVGGQGIEQGNLGDRGEPYHTDRSGSIVGGGILSRNTSMSSLTTAGDKSVDGEHPTDITSRNELETEVLTFQHPPQASTGYPTPTATVSSPPQPQRHAVASYLSQSVSASAHLASATILAAATPNSGGGGGGGEENQSGLESKTHRVEKALSHLNKELQQLVEENKEITRLKDLNQTLEERCQKHEEDIRRMEDERLNLEASNTDLTSHVANLRRRLDESNHQNQQLATENKKLLHEKQQLLEENQQVAEREKELRQQLETAITGQSSS